MTLCAIQNKSQVCPSWFCFSSPVCCAHAAVLCLPAEFKEAFSLFVSGQDLLQRIPIHTLMLYSMLATRIKVCFCPNSACVVRCHAGDCARNLEATWITLTVVCPCNCYLRRRWHYHHQGAGNRHAVPRTEPIRGRAARHDQRGRRRRQWHNRLPYVHFFDTLSLLLIAKAGSRRGLPGQDAKYG
jgi:hypothetical protein